MNCLNALTIDFLPEEILQRIIFLLPFKDLKNATSVCRRWLIIGEQKFAKRLRLCINHKNVGMMGGVPMFRGTYVPKVLCSEFF